MPRIYNWKSNLFMLYCMMKWDATEKAKDSRAFREVHYEV